MKRIAKWVGVLFAVLILILVSLPFLINVDQFRPTLQTQLSEALGRQVTLGNLRLKVWAGEVTADDLAVAEDPAFGKPAFLSAKSLHVGAEIWPFIFSRKLIVNKLIIDQPEITLVQSPSGDWNFSSLGGKSQPVSRKPASTAASAPLDLSVKLVRIKDGSVTLRRTVGHWKPLTLEQLNIELRDFTPDSAFPFSLAAQVKGGGTINLDGKAGPIDSKDAAMTPVSLNLKIGHLDLAKSGMNDVAPEVTGLASFDGTGSSDGVSMNLQAKLKAENLRLVKNGSPATRPLEVDLTVQHDLRKHAGTIHKGDIHIGSAIAHLTGTYSERGESMILNMKLAGPDMQVQELESLLPALGVVLPAGSSLKGGSASAELVMEGPADALVTSGSLALNNTKLVGLDLPQKMAKIERIAGIKGAPDTDIQVLSMNVRSAPEGTSAQDLKLVVPAIGELSGSGTVSPTNALDFKMSAIVHTSGLAAVIADKPIPFKIAGTASDPLFEPDIGAVVKEEFKGIGKSAGGLVNGLFGGGNKKQ